METRETRRASQKVSLENFKNENTQVSIARERTTGLTRPPLSHGCNPHFGQFLSLPSVSPARRIRVTKNRASE